MIEKVNPQVISTMQVKELYMEKREREHGRYKRKSSLDSRSSLEELQIHDCFSGIAFNSWLALWSSIAEEKKP